MIQTTAEMVNSTQLSLFIRLDSGVCLFQEKKGMLKWQYEYSELEFILTLGHHLPIYIDG